MSIDKKEADNILKNITENYEPVLTLNEMEARLLTAMILQNKLELFVYKHLFFALTGGLIVFSLFFNDYLNGS